MRKMFILLLMVVAFAGCATAVRYTPYTSQRFFAKPQGYFVTIYPLGQRPPSAQSYVVIGKVNISGRISDGVDPESLTQQAQAIARKKGADGIMNVKTENFTYNGVYTVPGHVSAHPVVFAGRHHEEVVYVENYHPARYIPYTDTVLTFEGELIVFTPNLPQEKK